MKIIKLSAIDSTNTYLKEMSKNMTLEDELIVVADEQTNGRGQRGNYWQSTKGESLTFSIFKKFTDLKVSDQINCLFSVSVGVLMALERLGLGNLSIKWPNDIMSEGKKLCGILIENQTVANKITAAVIGIGINVNESEITDLPQASSLFLITGKHFELEDVLEEVTTHVFNELNKLSTSNFESLRTQYQSVLYRRLEKSVFEDKIGNRFNGIINGVTNTGSLVIEVDGILKEFQFKEIKLLL